MESFGWQPAFTDYKQILEMLKSQDEMLIYEGVNQLSNQLAVAQENTLTSFQIDLYIPALIEILKMPQLSDMSGEISMFAIQCLTNLMDIFPTICNSIIQHGGVKCVTQVLERSMGYIDLNEACIKNLEKISHENPYAILTSGAIGLCLNMMDFFEQNTQKRIISLVLNVSRHSASEQDLNDHIMPIVPVLCMLLQSRDHDNSRLEIVSSVVLRIQESVMRFYPSHTSHPQIQALYENLGQSGILISILQCLQEYSIYDHSSKQESSPEKSSQESTINTSTNKVMTTQTIQNFLKILSLSARFSSTLAMIIIEYNIFTLIETFIPSQEDQQKLNYSSDAFPLIHETLSFMDCIFPDSPDSLSSEIEKPRTEIELSKRELFQTKEASKVTFIAEKLLPRVFNVYESNINSSIRTKALQIIDKMISLFNNELLNNFIEPYSFAKFIYSSLRTNNLTSILICLRMIEKLMNSNPRAYTLPLMREGVVPFIEKLSSIEKIEKHLGLQLVSEPPLEKEESFLIQAKQALLAGGPPTDPSSKIQFELTMQRYLEAARLTSQSSTSSNKSQVDLAKQVVALANPLLTNFFQNQGFLAQIESWCGDEIKIINGLKDLADRIKEEASSDVFNFEKSKDLMKSLAECLTSSRHIMSYEFKESGILEALELYLTRSPMQAKFYLEKQKNDLKGEEMKHSEELEMSGLNKGSLTVKKRESRAYIQRLRLFAMVIVSQTNEKRPIYELLNLCHDLLSQSENQIFTGQVSLDQQQQSLLHPSGLSPFFGSGSAQQQFSESHQSISALKQLTRRTRINLIFDQQKNFLKKVSQPGSDSIDEAAEDKAETMMRLSKPALSKAQSHHPAFSKLADAVLPGDSEHSKVFIKRHFLYSELKQVLISVEQCASLYLLEDFLKNKIKNEEDVKNLKQPSAYYGGGGPGGQGKPTQSSRIARHIAERGLDRMRDILEGPKEQMKQMVDIFSQHMVEEILSIKELTDEDQENIIRQLETQSLHLMDEFYANEDNQFDEGMRDESLDRVEHDQEIEQRIFELQRAIDSLKETFRAKKELAKAQQALRKEIKASKSAERRESEMIVDESEEERQLEQSAKLKKQTEDVEMTDEEGEESKRRLQEIENKYKLAQLRKAAAPQREVELTIEEDIDEGGLSGNKDILNTDLEELIKSTGEDIEFEFYFNGKLVQQNQTLFEITKDAPLTRETSKRPPGFSYGSYYTGSSSESSNIYFVIKDKNDELRQQRKDSILEFANKRERAKSEAVEDISSTSVNSIVQQIIEKEFSVFTKDLAAECENKIEKKQLHQALKVLKVLNFVSKNQQILSNQGIKFLMNAQSIEEESKEDGMSDFDMQYGISQIHQNVFHHHKLDSFILKSLQDPYTLISGSISETLQQIFKSCPFLFSFHTRQLFFKLVSFIGSIDMNRSIYFLRQFLKQKHGKLPEDKNGGVKIQRQKVVIDRTRILDSAFQVIKQVNKRAFLEVQYRDEVGTGQGPTLEFYSLIAEEIKNPLKAIWRAKLNDNSLFPSPISVNLMSQDAVQKTYDMYRLTGLMIAKSISDDRLIDLPISSVFWDLVLGKRMNLFDLERLDKDQFKVFSELQIIANKKKEIDKQHFVDLETKVRQVSSLRTSQGVKVEDFGLTFVLPGYENIELKMEGKDMGVTLENLQDYIDLVMHFTFHETIKIQISAFRKGFGQIFPVESLKPFSTSIELEDMICGSSRNDEDWKIQKLQETILAAHGYHQKSSEFKDFLRFMSELTIDERREFLKFITGSPRLPHGGFAALDPKMTVVHKKPLNPKDNPDHILPSVMTCQNYVKLPSYSNLEILKSQFKTAYTEGSNNFNLS